MNTALLATTAWLTLGPATYALAQGAPPQPSLPTSSTAPAANPDARPSNAVSATLQEVVVTASRRAQDLEKTPISITTLAGSDLNRNSRTQIDEVLQGVPGVKVQALSQGFAVAVRGVGVETTPGIGDPAIASNYDGIYSDRTEAGRIAFFDVNRVEVLRGPQGTLYGRAAAGGVLNVLSNDPQLGRFGAFGEVGGGSYGAFRSEGEVNLPVGDDLALRGAFLTDRRNGYYSNGQSDADDVAGRLKLLWRPNSTFKLLVGAQLGHVTGQGVGNTPGFVESHSDNVYKVTTASPNAYDFVDRKVWLQAEVDLGFGVLTVIPSYQDFNSYFDENLGPFDVIYHERELQTSVETRLAAEPSSPIKWTTGFYYYKDQHNTNTSSPATELELFNTQSYAGFAEATIPFYDNRVRFTGGVRETVDMKSDAVTDIVADAATSAALNKNFYHFDYKVNLEGDLTRNSLLYGTISTGYRPGGLYDASANSVFRSETLTAYEVGSKNRFLSNRLQLNGDVFYYNYDNFQATNTVFVNGAPVQAIFNAPSVTTYGAEIEAIYLLTPVDRLRLSEAYLHSRFNSGFVLEGVDYAGRPTGHAPTSQTTVGYSHTFELSNIGKLTLEADTTYETSSYVTFAVIPYGQQRPYTLSNALVTYDAPGHWTLSAYIKNIENVAVKGQALSMGTTSLVLLSPRIFGLNVGYKF